jgi:PAS domain S-box-containing protein
MDLQSEVVMDALPTAIILFDGEACVIYANTLAGELFGKSVNALEGLKCGDFIACAHRHEDPRGCGHSQKCPYCPLLRAIRETLKASTQPEVLEGEALLERENGLAPKWITYKVNGIVKDDRRAAVMVVEDITERKRTRETLRHTLERYEQQVRLFEGITSTTLDFVQIFDPQGRFLYANSRLLEVWGKQLADIVGKTHRELGYEQWQHDLHMREIATVIDTRRPIKGEVAFKSAFSGKAGIYEYIFTPVISPDGEVERIAGITRDVTERNQMEQALHKSEQHLRDVLDHMVALIGVMTPEGILIEANRTALDVAQLELQDVLNKPFVESYWWSGSSEEQKRLQDAIERGAAGQGSRYDAVIRGAGGELMVIDFMLSPMFDPDGRVEYLIPSAIDITQRKQAEEALQRAYGLIQGITTGTQDLIAAEDSQFRYIFFNDAYRREFQRLWGREIEIGSSMIEMMAPFAEDQRKARDLWQRALNGESFSITTAFGSSQVRQVYDLQFNPIYDADGRLMGAAHIIRNTTERTRIQETLRETEERLRLALKAADQGTWDYDLDNERIHISTDTARIFGLQTPGLLSRREDWNRYVVEEDRARLQQTVTSALRAGGRFRIEYRIIRANDGMRRWVLTEGQVVNDAGGRPSRLIGIARDISDQKQVAQALSDSERRYRGLFHSMEAFALMEPAWNGAGQPRDFRYLEVNEAGARLRGFTPEAMRGRTVLELLPQINPQWLAAYSHVILTGEPVQFELSSQINDRWYRTYAYSPEEGKVASLILDITDRKRAEQNLQELTRTLEQKVAERTELAEARARQLQALAVELIEAEERQRRQFAHLLHDDLQQLMAAAKMQVNAVADRVPGEPILSHAAQLLEEAITKSRRLSHELSPAVLHQSGLAAGLKWLATQMDEQFGMKIDLQIATGLQVDIAPVKIFLFRAVQELLFNCFKHAEVKSSQVVLSSADGSLVITVSDQGKGFDPAILENSTEKIGFGLMTIRERAHHIGGDLTVESAPSQGSRFTLAVPLYKVLKEKQQTMTQADLQPRAGNEAMAAGSGAIRIVFVDDHKIMRKGLIQLISNQADIQVVGEAADGREAIEKARQLKPNVMVMDVSMPLMDGIEATRHIKAEMPHIRIIGLSMFEDEAVTAAMRRAGADTFISKTASTAKLLQAIFGTPS